MADIMRKIFSLKPELIDVSKCTQHTSLYEQIQRNSNDTLIRQKTQFNLGNGLYFSDPIKAADYLLEREYAESFLFDQTRHQPLFIPPVFKSTQYNKGQSILDYDVHLKIRETLDNLMKNDPSDWFTVELSKFLQTQSDNEINSRDYSQWILNAKIMYLVIKEIGSTTPNLPSTTSELNIVLQGCINELPVHSTLVISLKHCLSLLPKRKGRTLVKAEINKQVETNPSEDSNIKWLWELQLSDIGECLEHTFFDELSAIDDHTLDDLVILQSAQFMTNVKNKKHREFDILMFSYSRKLVIGIELKRTSSDEALDKACTQLEKYRKSLEELLGDQLDNGWQFYPVICVEKDTLPFQTQHYINMTVDLNLWLSNILKRFPLLSKSSLPNSLEHLKNVFRIIVFSVHVSVPITSTNWVEYITKAIETVSTTDNVLFYSTNQLPAFKSTDPKFDKLILWGGYGTGKSLLLREKALQLSRQDPSFYGRIMYVHHSFDNIGSLQVSYLKNMLEPHGIIVKSFLPKAPSLLRNSTKDDEEEDLITNNNITKGYSSYEYAEEANLTEMVTKNNIKAIFLDEWKILPKEEIEKMISLVKICWIAPDIDEYCFDARKESIREEFIEPFAKALHGLRMNFEFLDLKLNLRNSRKIVETSMLLNQDDEREISYNHAGITMPPQNFPCGQPSVFVDSLEEAIAMARKFTKGGILVIEGAFYLKESTKLFMNNTGEKWKLNSQLAVTEDAYKLLAEGYILFVNYCENVTGFEWPVVICTPFNSINLSLDRIDYHRRNIFMRCTTYLIVISKRQMQFRNI